MISEFPSSIHFNTRHTSLLHCHSNIPNIFTACKISLRLWRHPFQPSTSTYWPLTTLYSQNVIGFYSQAANPTWVTLLSDMPSFVMPPQTFTLVLYGKLSQPHSQKPPFIIRTYSWVHDCQSSWFYSWCDIPLATDTELCVNWMCTITTM